jgi:hypothetical protein
VCGATSTDPISPIVTIARERESVSIHSPMPTRPTPLIDCAPTAGAPSSRRTSHRVPAGCAKRHATKPATATIAAAVSARRHERTAGALVDRGSRNSASMASQIASGASTDGRCSTIAMPDRT